MKIATVRDLRNHFPRIKAMVESEGEVIVTDNGKPKYRIMLYTPKEPRETHRAKDYMERLKRHQSHPISRTAAKSLLDDNRGDR
jgi:antitoxin (DNA-binding transcriptional repressor) of toxin-antitoxin stability system